MAHEDPDLARDEAERTPAATPIVAIGASAGGIKALLSFFEAVPEDIGASFVVVVHLDPKARSELPHILTARSKLTAVQVVGTSALRPNCIYVIAPDKQLRISDHEVAAVPFDQPRGRRAPIDILFRSQAETNGDGFAVVLSGAGSDGAAGVTAIKDGGGIVLVQSPEEAEYPSMPRSAIATGVVDFVLPARELAQRIVELVQARRHLPPSVQDDEEHLRHILNHLRVRTGHDFSLYKRSTVLRRIVRRMQVTRKPTLESYFQHLRSNADEVAALLADLLISVTTFFRDPGAFESLARNAIENLLRRENDGSPLRIWVAACATGEEAYSIAMLFLENDALRESHRDIQIFASDMDTRALAIAREGRYPIGIEADISEDRLRRFFIRDGEYYQVRRELRDIVLFASHSVLRDPPFSRVDLISCRNLLIYLDRDLQVQILTTLHYALNKSGYLFLGASESAEQPPGLFRTIDRAARLYQSTGHSTDHATALPRLSNVRTGVQPLLPRSTPAIPSAFATLAAHREALETNAPSSVLIDSTFNVIHLSETAGRYLMPSAGPLTADVTELVRPELRFDLRIALNRVFERAESTLSGAIQVRFNGKAVRVYLLVKPMCGEEGRAERALVLFIEGEAHEPLYDSGASQQAQDEATHHLRQELELAHSRLRTMREESEAATEELRATNEELQSINEEYRSTAEELETGKEELQSINEELQTVNSELKIKLDSVSRANSDLQNFIAAADIATLFLDPTFRIKRFTPTLAQLFNITPNDVGRPIGDFTHHLEYDEFSADAARVMENLLPIEREVRSHADRLFLVRFRPYRTTDDKIDGVVITFIDVTERRRMEGALRDSQDALRGSEQQLRDDMRLIDLSRSPSFVWDFETGEVIQWNRGCELVYGYSRAEAVGHKIDGLLQTASSAGSFADIRDAIAAEKFWSGELVQRAKNMAAVKVEAVLELIESAGRRLILEMDRTVL